MLWVAAGEPQTPCLSFGMSVASMGDMLKICNDCLPDSDSAYIAFRLACRDTLERMLLMEQVGMLGEQAFGYLTEVPFLKHVPPQVQIDLLAETWRRHTSEDLVSGSLLDESVVYAVCETAVRLIAADRPAAERLLAGGPRKVKLGPTTAAVQQVHALHLDLSNEGDFLLISQFQDIPPTEARILKAKFGVQESACDVMFDALGRWHASSEFPGNAAGLLTRSELQQAADLLVKAAAAPRSAAGTESVLEDHDGRVA